MIGYQIANVFQIPFIFTTALTLLFYEFGINFLAGVGVFLLGLVANLAIGIWLNFVQKKLMKAKDGRMKATTESIENIKMIKLYSW